MKTALRLWAYYQGGAYGHAQRIMVQSGAGRFSAVTGQNKWPCNDVSNDHGHIFSLRNIKDSMLNGYFAP